MPCILQMEWPYEDIVYAEILHMSNVLHPSMLPSAMPLITWNRTIFFFSDSNIIEPKWYLYRGAHRLSFRLNYTDTREEHKKKKLPKQYNEWNNSVVFVCEWDETLFVWPDLLFAEDRLCYACSCQFVKSWWGKIQHPDPECLFRFHHFRWHSRRPRWHRRPWPMPMCRASPPQHRPTPPQYHRNFAQFSISNV